MRTYIGTGLLGAGFVKAFLNRGEAVTVWNRTAEKAQKLAKDGANVAKTLEDAVKDADIIHMTLSDDTAVDDVLENSAPHFKKGVTILDHTTTSADGAAERSKKWNTGETTYIHSPVMMNPNNALNATGAMLISGNQEAIKEIMPEIEPMTGQVINLGENVKAAAGMKLITNLYLVAVNSGISDILNISSALDIPNDSIKEAVGAMNPAGLFKGSLDRVQSDDIRNNPLWELVMARKDVRLMIEEGKKTGNTMVAMPAAAKEMDKWIENGHAHDDWAIFASGGAEK